MPLAPWLALGVREIVQEHLPRSLSQSGAGVDRGGSRDASSTDAIGAATHPLPPLVDCCACSTEPTEDLPRCLRVAFRGREALSAPPEQSRSPEMGFERTQHSARRMGIPSRDCATCARAGIRCPHEVGPMSSHVELCEHHAKDCLQAAEKAEDPLAREMLLRHALEWMRDSTGIEPGTLRPSTSLRRQRPPLFR
jgi:hypothetical protein